MKKISIKDTQIITGIYLIKYPNNKVYIGQSQNIHLRMLDHNSRARNNHRGNGKAPQICDLAIKKYFPNGVEEYYILEQCLIKELDTKEDYWIKYYDALNKDKGYNQLDKGDVSGRRGINNVNASINEQQLKDIINLLQNNYELSYQDIADKTNSTLNVVQAINWGKRYVDSSFQYPLRASNNHVSTQKNNVKDYFKNEEELLNLKNDLKWSWWLSIETDLVKKYNIPLKIMHEINNGKKFEDIGNYKYPIRNKNIRNKNNLTKEDILNILKELRETSISMENIGIKYNFGRAAIRKINAGETYIIKDYDYPARKTK